MSLATPAVEQAGNIYDEPPTSEKQSGHDVHFQDAEGDAPPQPPRPADPREQAEVTLIEAFPSIDTKVVKAVLTASGGQLEPAFNALLSTHHCSFKRS